MVRDPEPCGSDGDGHPDKMGKVTGGGLDVHGAQALWELRMGSLNTLLWGCGQLRESSRKMSQDQQLQEPFKCTPPCDCAEEPNWLFSPVLLVKACHRHLCPLPETDQRQHEYWAFQIRSKDDVRVFWSSSVLIFWVSKDGSISCSFLNSPGTLEPN